MIEVKVPSRILNIENKYANKDGIQMRFLMFIMISKIRTYEMAWVNFDTKPHKNGKTEKNKLRKDSENQQYTGRNINNNTRNQNTLWLIWEKLSITRNMSPAT